MFLALLAHRYIIIYLIFYTLLLIWIRLSNPIKLMLLLFLCEDHKNRLKTIQKGKKKKKTTKKQSNK